MILVMGGTSEARDLVDRLDTSTVVYTTVTRNPTHINRFKNFPRIHLVGYLDRARLVATVKNHGIKKLIDATHPFAVNASLNAIEACRECGIAYFRLDRPRVKIPSSELIHEAADFKEAMLIIRNIENRRAKRILLSIGVNNLGYFQELFQDNSRQVYCQVLDTPGSLLQAKGYGILPEQILLAKGVPAMEEICGRLAGLQVNLMVFKESGCQGGTDAKIKAGMVTGTPMILIERPHINYPSVFEQVRDVVDVLSQGAQDRRTDSVSVERG